MTTYIGNAFSLSMLPPREGPGFVRVEDLTIEQARELAAQPFTSCVGHADTARIMGQELGVAIDVHRCSVTLQTDDQILVAQYSGPRLPEGATELPEGASFRWILVTHDQTYACAYCKRVNVGKGRCCAHCGAC